MSISVGPGIPNRTPANLADALHHLSPAAPTSGIPVEYLRALRHGTAGDRVTVVIAERQTTVTLASSGAHRDPAQERDSWTDLCETIAAVNAAGVDTVTTSLPREIAAATWEHDGATIRARRPRVLRKLRLSALSPLPLLAELLPSSTAASSAAAVSIALAPMPPAVLNSQPPPHRTVTITSGDITRPEPRHLLDFHTPAAGYEQPLIRRADTAPDTAPDTSPPAPAPVLPPTPAAAPPPSPPTQPAAPPSPSTEATTPPPEPTSAPEPAPTPVVDADPAPTATSAPTTTPRTRSDEPRKRRPWHARHRPGHRHR